MATIHFSASLAEYTGGVESMTLDAPRVRELMQAVKERFPALSDALEIMAVAVDGEIHQEPEYLKLAADSEICFVPRIAGG